MFKTVTTEGQICNTIHCCKVIQIRVVKEGGKVWKG